MILVSSFVFFILIWMIPVIMIKFTYYDYKHFIIIIMLSNYHFQ